MLLVPTIFIFSFLRLVGGFGLSAKENDCLIQGEQCSSNCSAVVYCTGLGGTEILLDDCQSKGENCATINGEVKCSQTETDCPILSGEPFKCLQSGPFPDPLDCQSSYICQSNSPDPVIKCECERGYFWDSSFNQCSNEHEGLESCCIAPQSKPNCHDRADGNFGPNCHPGYYYVCVLNPDGKYQIYVLRCESNMVYNPLSHTCERVDTSSPNLFGLLGSKKKDDGIGTKTDAQCSVISTTTSGTTNTATETARTTVTVCETTEGTTIETSTTEGTTIETTPTTEGTTIETTPPTTTEGPTIETTTEPGTTQTTTSCFTIYV